MPNVNWNDGKMNVNWYNSDNSNDNLRARQKFLQQKEHYSSFCAKYLIQPFVILEISCKSVSNWIYFFVSIIFNSSQILKSRFNISVFIRADESKDILFVLISKLFARVGCKNK